VLLVHLALLEQAEIQDRPGLLDSLVNQVIRVRLVILVGLVPGGRLVLRVTRDRSDRQVRLVLSDYVVLRVVQVKADLLASLVPQACKVPLVRRAHQVQRELLVCLEHLDSQASTASLEELAPLDSLVPTDKLAA